MSGPPLSRAVLHPIGADDGASHRIRDVPYARRLRAGPTPGVGPAGTRRTNSHRPGFLSPGLPAGSSPRHPLGRSSLSRRQMRDLGVFTRAADGVMLWWERIGAGPPVVLLPGRGDSSDLFPSILVDRLVRAGLSVVRMDPRDTGLSGDGGDEYTLSTLADDVVAVLGAADVDRAHTVAVSMGGMVTVDLVSRFPDRVLSSAFIAAMSPDPEGGMGPDFFAPLQGGTPAEMLLALMGSPDDEDRDWLDSELVRSARRSPARPDAGQRHMAASFRFGWPGLDQLDRFSTPALVIHGTADRVLPLRHARSFAAGIDGSNLQVIEGMGHLPTQREWHRIAQLVSAHFMA